MDDRNEKKNSANYVPPDHRLRESDAPVRKRKARWPWVLLVLLVGLICYWAFFRHGSSANAQPQGAGGGHRASTGPVTITTVTATKGDIDARPYEAQVMQAEGLLERDQNLLAQAQMDLERYRTAWAENAIQRQTLEDQEKIVLQDQGTVKNDEGTLRYDQVQLSYCHITSPIDGRVGLRLVDPGNLVTANSTTSLVVITQTQPITVVATISEDNLSQVLQQPLHGPNLPLDGWDRTNQKKNASGKVTSFDNEKSRAKMISFF